MQTQSEFSLFGPPVSSPDNNASSVNLQFDFIEMLARPSTFGSIQGASTSRFELAAKQPLQILVVDDNEINRKVVQTILSQLGYQSREAAGGNEALEVIRSQSINYIFTDIDMPKMNGIEMAAEIRSLEAQSNSAPKIEIIAVTANISKESRKQCRKTGMNGFLEKPVNTGTIKRQLLRSWARIHPNKRPPTKVGWLNSV